MCRFFITVLILLSGLLPVRADTERLLNSLKPAGYVSDFAGVMNSADRITVERILAELEKKCGAQIAVVTLQSLEGGQIDDFAARLFERWKIGQKGKDNGFLLIAAIEDRKMRIETGYGFEGVLPDAAAGRLIDQIILPAFRAGNYSGGLRSGALALASVAASASGVELSGASDLGKNVRPQEGIPDLYFIIGFFGIAFLVAFNTSHNSSRPSGSGRFGGGGFSGGGFGGGGFGGFGGGMSGGGGASRGW